MNPGIKSPLPSRKRLGRGQNILIFCIFSIALILLPQTDLAEEFIVSSGIQKNSKSELALIQENTLLSVAGPLNPESETKQIIKVIATGYSSTPWETDGDPYITASGASVGDGIIANNLLPFGTKIRLPEIYGDKIFVVKDRMNRTKGNYHIDIWFSDYWEAKNFGVRRTYIEVLDS